MPDLALELGLPANIDAERFVLGAVLQDHSLWEVAATLTAREFALEKHRRIFVRMAELHQRGERIDRVTVANELQRVNQLESVDGFSYLVSLDEGLPTLVGLDSYVSIVREKSALRQTIFSAQRLIDRALTGEGSAAELGARFNDELAGMSKAEVRGLESTGKIIEDAGIPSFVDPNIRAGVPTGFTRPDQMTGGLQRGELIVLAARPSMGKTALALNIAANIAFGRNRQRKPGDDLGTVAVFSLEMPRRSLILRLACAEARIDSQKQRAGFLNQYERRRLAQAVDELSRVPLFIDDASCTVFDMLRKLRGLRAEAGRLDLVVIDYLGLIPSHAESESRPRQIGLITQFLKARLAKELDVPVLLLSQLSRASEKRAEGDHRPILSDLRESGDIEQDADLVAFIFREEVYKPDREDLKGSAELIVAKSRNGPTGTTSLVWLSKFTKFENHAWDKGQVA